VGSDRKVVAEFIGSPLGVVHFAPGFVQFAPGSRFVQFAPGSRFVQFAPGLILDLPCWCLWLDHSDLGVCELALVST
jgi:hypothetical protein